MIFTRLQNILMMRSEIGKTLVCLAKSNIVFVTVLYPPSTLMAGMSGFDAPRPPARLPSPASQSSTARNPLLADHPPGGPTKPNRETHRTPGTPNYQPAAHSTPGRIQRRKPRRLELTHVARGSRSNSSSSYGISRSSSPRVGALDFSSRQSRSYPSVASTTTARLPPPSYPLGLAGQRCVHHRAEHVLRIL